MPKFNSFTSERPLERLPINYLCPICAGDLKHNDTNFRCNTCNYQETIAENLKRNVTYFINGKTYTKEEVDKYGI